MRKSIIALVLLLVPMVAITNGDTVFTATLNGAQANAGAGTGSSATGLATLLLNDAMTELTMSIEFDGITTADITSFHIHIAPAGANGGVAFGLVSPNSDTNGDFMDLGNGFFSVWDGAEGQGTTLADQLDNLFNEGLYFNAHTAAFPGGEIRGQILRGAVPEPSSAFILGMGFIGLFSRRKKSC